MLVLLLFAIISEGDDCFCEDLISSQLTAVFLLLAGIAMALVIDMRTKYYLVI